MHGGLFSEDGVTLDDIRKIERNRQPPDSGEGGGPVTAPSLPGPRHLLRGLPAPGEDTRAEPLRPRLSLGLAHFPTGLCLQGSVLAHHGERALATCL